MHSKHWISALAFVGIGLAAAAPADAISLTTLLGTPPGNNIVVGNVVYSNFSYGGTTPSSDVVVTTTATGLEFSTLTGGWTLPSGSSVIGYDITITGGNVQTVGLGFSATASGGAAAFVGETITDVVNTKDYSLQVYTDGPGGLTDTPGPVSVNLTPSSPHLHVVKSIDVASSGTGTASITVVDNTFTQTGGATPGVPEPMSLALLPLGIAGLLLRKRIARA